MISWYRSLVPNGSMYFSPEAVPRLAGPSRLASPTPVGHRPVQDLAQLAYVKKIYKKHLDSDDCNSG